MGYDEQKVKSGRQPVYILEMDIKGCPLTFGEGDCNAVEDDPGSGTKCFDTFKTCQDTAAYLSANDPVQTIKQYRFSSLRVDSLQQEGDAPTFPTLTSYDMAPARLQPGKGLGYRASAKVTLQDHPWTDVGVDKYIDENERQYIPDEQGSFWGKFLARNPFYENDIVRIKQGYLADDGSYDEANMLTREYALYRISGPDKTGKVSIEMKDILRFADAIKAQVPRASVALLDADLLDSPSATSFDFTDTDAQIFNNFNLLAPFKQEYVIIDDEVIRINTLVDNGGGSYSATSVTRATLPSYYTGTVDREEHDEETLIQACINFQDIRLDDLLFYMLETGADIDDAFLDTDIWKEVIDFGMQNYLFSALLIEPEAVKDHLVDLSQYTVFFYWHERDSLVKMGSLLEKRLETLDVFGDNFQILKDSVSVTKDVTERASQVWVYYGHRSPLLDLDKLQYFTNLKVASDPSKEEAHTYGKPAIKKIFSRWLANDKQLVATEVSARLLDQYDETRNIISMSIDPKNDSAWTGQLINIKTYAVQDQFGESESSLGYLIIEANEKLMPDGVTLNYLLEEWGQAIGRYAVIANDKIPPADVVPMPDYDVASEELKTNYIFVAPGITGFSDGTRAYQVW